LEKGGIREVTFLGQNVNSYHDVSGGGAMGSQHVNTRGFSEVFKLRNEPGWRFCDLIEETAKGFPDMRFRFTSPHPKEFPVRLLETIAKYNNVCNHIHLPVQSGSS
jgi:tRNA A37 methylthiotransferase MiaB